LGLVPDRGLGFLDFHDGGQHVKIPPVITLDFETEAIGQRPDYPPKPVSFSIQMPGERRPTFHAWGHPEGNNTNLKTARRILQDAEKMKLPFLFHNAKFDAEVLMEFFDIELAWDRMHDDMFLLYLYDPHAKDLKLKPSAERLLGEAPNEQDAVRDWVLQNKRMLEAKYGGSVKPSQFGAWISKVPAQIVGPYANGDVSRTLGLFKYLYPEIAERGMLEAYDRERRLMPILLSNERQGMRVDTPGLRRDIKVYDAALAATDAWLRKRLKAPSLNVDSDQEFAEALARAGVVPDEAWTYTKTGQRSVSKDNLTLDLFTDPRVARAFGYRNRLTTCLSMFMKPWLAQAEVNANHITTSWNQVRQPGAKKNQGTRTGRPSTNNHNFLNISKTWYDKEDGYEHPTHLRVPELPLTRRYILPDRGGVFCHRDYNQQELRILAHFEDGALMAAYLENLRLDVHDFVRDLILDITGQEWSRRPVKIANFRTIYGGGAPAAASGIGCSLDEARQLLEAHKRALPDVKGRGGLDEELKRIGRAGEAINTWGGREYYCEAPGYSKKYGREMTFEYKLLNYIIQGSAADATKEAIIRYHDHPKKEGRFLVTVYDEVNVSADKGVYKSEMAVLRECMESIEFDVPLLTDGKTGPNWADVKKFAEGPSVWELKNAA
jgi:DNA polymerase I-like protein with 3'-5' exonuclease and polymerase domains